jgi:hypothetical protein
VACPTSSPVSESALHTRESAEVSRISRGSGSVHFHSDVLACRQTTTPLPTEYRGHDDHIRLRCAGI